MLSAVCSRETLPLKNGSSRSKCPSRKSGGIGGGEHGERQAQAWLAEKLRMRSAANASQQMRRLDKKRALGRVPEALKRFFEEVDGEAHE